MEFWVILVVLVALIAFSIWMLKMTVNFFRLVFSNWIIKYSSILLLCLILYSMVKEGVLDYGFSGMLAIAAIVIFIVFIAKSKTKPDQDYISRSHRKEPEYDRDSIPQSYSHEYYEDYYEQRPITQRRPELVSGSAEYWRYKEAAERICRKFCEANSSDEKRIWKEQGDMLKDKLLMEYGTSDSSAEYIIDRFLDLRL